MSEKRPPEALETDLRIEDRLALQQAQEQAEIAARTPISRWDLDNAIAAEVVRAERHGEKFSSLHEAYAVILEEIDEVWEITRMKRRDRSAMELRKEFIQIAAMAVKAINSMDNFVGGSV